MRESSLNNFPTADPRTAWQSEGKSLFRNILAASPCESRFCPDLAIPMTHKSLRMNILGTRSKKNSTGKPGDGGERNKPESIWVI
jgi:hypothetical protein